MPEPTLIGLRCPRCHGWVRATVRFAPDRGEPHVLAVECTSHGCQVTTEDVHELLTR